MPVPTLSNVYGMKQRFNKYITNDNRDQIVVFPAQIILIINKTLFKHKFPGENLT